MFFLNVQARKNGGGDADGGQCCVGAPSRLERDSERLVIRPGESGGLFTRIRACKNLHRRNIKNETILSSHLAS